VRRTWFACDGWRRCRQEKFTVAPYSRAAESLYSRKPSGHEKRAGIATRPQPSSVPLLGSLSFRKPIGPSYRLGALVALPLPPLEDPTPLPAAHEKGAEKGAKAANKVVAVMESEVVVYVEFDVAAVTKVVAVTKVDVIVMEPVKVIIDYEDDIVVVPVSMVFFVFVVC
jgi:hypothetical protein